MNTQIQPYLPDYVDLYYVNYDDNLRGHKDLLQKSLSSNSLDSIHEKIWEWWNYPEGYYLSEIREKMERDGAEELYEKSKDEIRDWLNENVTSTPVKDLLRNTGEISMFYSLGLELAGWGYGSIAKQAFLIRQKLGVKKGTPEADSIESIVRESYEGGELRIYFSNDLASVITDTDKDFQQIRFKGEFAVALYNSSVGSGDFEYIKIDKTFPFVRENLFTSESDKYSLENCFGMCGDWLTKYNAPTFSMEPIKTRQTIRKSLNSERMAREAELNRIFKEGGCTFGDMDYRRHRGTFYVNQFPCGSHCPHCGTFWID